MRGKKPNIIFFFSDQQRWDTAGCYGQPAEVTPNLDRLAREGTKFANAFTCQPVCGPARACLQTGRYAVNLGCYRNNIALGKHEKTLAHYLSEAGYKAGYVGKWHLASTGDASHMDIESEVQYITRGVSEERRGGYRDFWIASDVLEATSHGYGGYLFDEKGEKVEFTGYRADAVTDYALSYIKTWKKDEPHFLFLSHIEPHHQNDHNCFQGPEGSKEEFAQFTPPQDLLHAPGNWGSDWKEQYPDYLGCCKRLDKNLGRIMDCIEEMGIKEDCILIYTSDHGSHFKTRTVEYKRSCHDSSIHIPLVIWGGKNTESGFNTGKTETALVSLIDLPPTILRMAGIPVPACMQGRPVQEIWEAGIGKTEKKWQQEIFLQISESQVGRCIRTEKYKYSVRAYDKNGWLDADSDTYREEYLYDLEKDPWELNNLVLDKEYERVRKQLGERLRERMEEAGEKPPCILPAYKNNTVMYGMNGKFEDLLQHPHTREAVMKILPKGFLETIYCSKDNSLTAAQIGKKYKKELGDDFAEGFLDTIFRLEFNLS